MLFLQIKDYVLLEHAVWLINNITMDSVESYNLMLKCGVDEMVNDILNDNISLQFTKLIIFFFKNIQRKKKELNPNFSLVNI